jgi:hypothetical protein
MITGTRASSQLHRSRRSASALQVLAEVVIAGIGSWGTAAAQWLFVTSRGPHDHAAGAEGEHAADAAS